MIAGLHWTAWLLLGVAVGLGLVVELVFFFNQHSGDQKPAAGPTSPE